MRKSYTPYPNMCSELVAIDLRSSGPGLHRIQGNLEAIGEDSALMLTEEPLRPGADVRISASSGNTFNGIVESCRFDEPLGWCTEVRLSAASRWSIERFKPEHFLALGGWERMEVRKSA